MAIHPESIDHTTLERLVEAGAVRGADVIGHPGGWSILIKYGMTERALATRRGTLRTFRKFETLVTYQKGIGIFRYHVNAADYDPQVLKTTRVRPDASRRMKEAFQAIQDETAYLKSTPKMPGVSLNPLDRQGLGKRT